MKILSKTKIKLFAAITALFSCIAILTLSVFIAYLATYKEAENNLKTEAKDIQDKLQTFIKKTTDSLSIIINDKLNCKAENQQSLKRMVLNESEISIAYLQTANNKCATISPFDFTTITTQPVTNNSTDTKLIGPLHINGIIGPAYAIQIQTKNGAIGSIFPGYVLEEKGIGTPSSLLGFILSNDGENIYRTAPIPTVDNSLSINTDIKQINNLNLHVLLSKYWIWQKLTPHIILALILGGFLCGLVLMTIIKMTRHKLSLGGEISNGVKLKQFIPYYQAVKDLKTNQYTGVECLMRWQINDHDLIYPDFFIPAAERTGLIKPMTEQLINKIFDDLGNYLHQNPNFHIAINLSPQHLNDRDTFELVLSNCSKFKVNTNQVILEITEQELIKGDLNYVIALMNDMRSAGFTLAIDDFGTGHSSINYLRQFPFDYLKIDKIFVMAIGSEAITAQLADSIISLAKNLDLKIIAEGVETLAHEKYLKERGVEYGQGWLYSKAISIRKLQAFLKN